MTTLQQAQADHSIAGWVAFFKQAEIPVLRQTARDIAALRERQDEVGAKDITKVVINDPLMIVKVLSFANNHRSQAQLQDLVLVEQAIIMMGTTVFFEQIDTSHVVEAVLGNRLSALMDLLKLIIRAHRAGYFAGEFASHLKDLHAEEVRMAAVLHDISEMLMWCFNTEAMQQIAAKQSRDATLRSKAVQTEVLGFPLQALQAELVQVLNLPSLLTALMDEAHAQLPRIKNVQLAVNLARHSADGWDNLALPDDYREIAQLLHVDIARVMHIVGVPH